MLLANLVASPLVGLLSTAGAPPPPVGTADSFPRASVAAFLERVGRSGFSGVVLIAQGGEVLLQGAWGLADSASGAPMTVETAFDLGSLAQVFTAAAILRLEAARRLSVADSLGRFLPEAPADKRGITLHQLLTHTGGLAAHPAAGAAPSVSRGQVLQAIFDAPLRFRPGAGFAMSNAGYALLAAVVEQASGRSFPDFLRGELFDRIGLGATGFTGESRWRDQPVATGYRNGARQQGAAEPAAGWAEWGHGGVVSTAGDLLRWFRALLDGTVVSPGHLEQMFAPLATQGQDAWFGYGWSIETSPLGRRIGLRGQSAGGDADLSWYADRDLLVVTLGNRLTLRSWRGLVPLRVSLPAAELSRQLATNLARNEFRQMPRDTFRARSGLVTGGMALAALVLLLGLVWSRWRRELRRS